MKEREKEKKNDSEWRHETGIEWNQKELVHKKEKSKESQGERKRERVCVLMIKSMKKKQCGGERNGGSFQSMFFLSLN